MRKVSERLFVILVMQDFERPIPHSSRLEGVECPLQHRLEWLKELWWQSVVVHGGVYWVWPYEMLPVCMKGGWRLNVTGVIPRDTHHHYKISKLMDWTLECFLLSDYPVGVKLCDWITFIIYYIVHVNNLFLRFHFKTINSICSEFITGVGHLWRSMTVTP